MTFSHKCNAAAFVWHHMLEISGVLLRSKRKIPWSLYYCCLCVCVCVCVCVYVYVYVCVRARAFGRCRPQAATGGSGSHEGRRRGRLITSCVLLHGRPILPHIMTKTKLRGLSPPATIPTERQPLAGELSATFCG
jgi:hypothetical protein